MDEATCRQLKELQQALKAKHPTWSQDKARWIASQIVCPPGRKDGWH